MRICWEEKHTEILAFLFFENNIKDKMKQYIPKLNNTCTENIAVKMQKGTFLIVFINMVFSAV